ncbi:hypothetical protein BH23PSE1_BH23PSE1_17730 [soil metagenome]
MMKASAAGEAASGLPALPPILPRTPRRVALICDPRFRGGTSAAVAAELRALAGTARLSVAAIETAMFRGRAVHPAIAAALEETGTPLDWNPPVIRADAVLFHNPSCLRYDRVLRVRISCETALVVTHENFLRPNGSEGFDVGACLDRIEDALICGRRFLAPVSAANRQGVAAWLGRGGRDWSLLPRDWTNVLDLPRAAPSPCPRDRRGRHSRPGLEKFPPLEVLRAHFPPHAERSVILGGDMLLRDPEALPPHWDVRRFGTAADVARCLAEIDFFVYFTPPAWSESFGRAIAEAIAAGKLVITDPGTAQGFGPGVIASDGRDVDAIVRRFIEAPEEYAKCVRAAQDGLEAFGPAAFAARAGRLLETDGAPCHALV